MSYAKRITLAEGGFAGLSGHPGSHVLHSEALALYSTPAGPPSNQATLDALALKMATDFWAWRSRAFDRVYNGIVVPKPSGLIDTIEWSYDPGGHEDAADFGDPVPFIGGCSTRVMSAPLGSEPERYQQQDPAVAGCIDDPGTAGGRGSEPCVKMYLPGASGTSWPWAKVCHEGGRTVVTERGVDTLDCGCEEPCTPNTIPKQDIVLTYTASPFPLCAPNPPVEVPFLYNGDDSNPAWTAILLDPNPDACEFAGPHTVGCCKTSGCATNDCLWIRFDRGGPESTLRWAFYPTEQDAIDQTNTSACGLVLATTCGGTLSSFSCGEDFHQVWGFDTSGLGCLFLSIVLSL
jgi:hypothetical protein